MERIGNIIPRVIPPQQQEEENESRVIDCANCKSEVEFAPGQWRRRCPRCGLFISLGMPVPAKKKELPKCFVCLDRGIIIYDAQVDNVLYTYAARCNCSAGMTRPEKKFPTIDQISNGPDMKYLAYKNKKEWEQVNPSEKAPKAAEGYNANLFGYEVPFNPKDLPF